MKSIRYEKQILIVLLWSALIFIGYNILTAEASEKEDKKVCEEYGGEWKNNPNDYGDDRGCMFENEKDQQAYAIRPGYSKDGTGSDAEYGRLDLDMSDDEAAAIEDDICDNEDASITNIKLCMSDEREQEVEERKELDKELYTSKTFKNLLESKGIDYDDYKNDILSSEKQDELETEFREDKSDEYAEEINNKDDNNKEQEQNDLPNKLSPFYNSEPAVPVEDWRNEVETTSEPEGPPPPPPEQDNYEIGSPVVVKEQEQEESSEDEYEESSYEYEESSYESEESSEEEEEEPEEEEEEETEEDSDSEGKE